MGGAGEDGDNEGDAKFREGAAEMQPNLQKAA
jgi:hypothetical protein